MKGLQFDSRQYSVGTAFTEYKLPINVGPDEVVVLHSIDVGIELPTAAISVRGYFSLKSVKVDGAVAPEVENDLLTDKHTFWRFGYRIAAGGLIQTSHPQMWFDPPLILIRQPRICVVSSSATSTYYNVFLYYTKEKVTRDKMAQLIVKKHS